ncbi:MAG TPA: hypothetical protein O0X27_06930, partial [Methanocorpusculum sp.]|nr:hypothetical protein [Methanocorpusculum sp.]
MSLKLTPEIDALIKQEIEAGKYTSMSDAVLSKLRDWYEFADLKRMVLESREKDEEIARLKAELDA